MYSFEYRLRVALEPGGELMLTSWDQNSEILTLMENHLHSHFVAHFIQLQDKNSKFSSYESQDTPLICVTANALVLALVTPVQ